MERLRFHRYGLFDDYDHDESDYGYGYTDSDYDDVDSDYDNNDSDYKEEVREEVFRRILERIARNDKTLTALDDWLSKDEDESHDEDERHEWHISDADLILLGGALTNNTHLKSLSITMKIDRLAGTSSTPDHTSLREGIAQSQLHALTLDSRSDGLQTTLLEGIRMPLTLRCLTIKNQSVKICDVAALLVAPAVESLSHRSHLCHLHLDHAFELDDGDMLTLSLGLVGNRCLLSLTVKNSAVTDAGVMHLCQHWGDDSCLQQLDLSKNLIGSTGAQLLLRATAQHPGLTTLVLDGNELLGHPALPLIGEQLPQIRVQHLEICSCVKEEDEKPTLEMQNRSNQALAIGLRGNTTLVSLHVGGNCLGASGAQMLMQAISSHPALQNFSLALDESIGLAGVQLIGQELPNVRLKKLVLTGVCPLWPTPQSELARKAGQSLLHGVQHNFHLTELRFEELDDTWMQSIQFFLLANETCRRLFSSGSPSIWPHVFTRPFYSFGSVSHIYFALREQPWLIRNVGGGQPS